MSLYVVTIVLPIGVLLWLGLESFARQRQSLLALTAEKVEATVESATRAAAASAFLDRSQPVAKYFFALDAGVVVEPALHGPAPRDTPMPFLAAERQELELNRLGVALESYRKLTADRATEPLALSRVARVLSKLGRNQEARDTWRRLAAKYPDERDLAGRPFGIVAAMNAGDTAGLAERITSGRWALSNDQAEYFLGRLGVSASPYFERFRFAQALSDNFTAPRTLRTGDLGSFRFDGRTIFYQASGPDRIEGFLVDPEWAAALRARTARELGIGNARRPELLLYAGALAVVLLVLSAGAAVLWRDVARETRMNRLRSEFVSGVSHELKTPITLVQLYGDTLLRQESLSSAERQEFYRIITRESARLGRLVDHILTFARVERGAEHYDLQPGDIGALVALIVDDYGEWLEHAGFAVSRAIPDGLPPIRFDRAAVTQALVNLLDNATKYSGDARDIRVSVEARDGHVNLEVRDRGIGIAPADRQRIFERFCRASHATGKGGYGLGLFMVRHIMDVHGGRAEVDSEPGRGSTFRLVFPIVA